MIIHVDADAFFASVLVRQQPSLRGKPLLALGMGGGCVIAASYEAKAKGVKTGMRLKDALQLVPGALRLPSDFRETGLASQQIESVLREICPVVEQMSIDEWFLDLQTVTGGMPPSLTAFADRLRKDILARVGLSMSVGIAPSKLLAKMASEYRKPGGVTVLFNPSLVSLSPDPSPGGGGAKSMLQSKPLAREEAIGYCGEGLGVREFLRDRPTAAIPGIGPRRQTHCESEGWVTAWDIAKAPADKIQKLFGRPGLDMQRELLGERVFAVREEAAPQQSISRARSFPAEGNEDFLWAHVLRHLEYIVLKMRRRRQSATGVSVWLRDASFAYRSTHCSLPRPMDTEEALQPFVRRCFHELHRRNGKYTQTGLALWKLTPGGTRQFSLFEDPKRALNEEGLQQSLDVLHEKYGRNTVTRGSALRVKSGSTSRTTGGMRRGLDLPIYE